MAHKIGSATLLLMLIISTLTLLASVAMQRTNQTFALTLDRIRHAQFRHALDALALYGVAHCLASISATPKKQPEKISLNYSQWPPQKGLFQGSIWYQLGKGSCLIGADLQQDNGLYQAIECRISKADSGWIISQWRHT